MKKRTALSRSLTFFISCALICSATYFTPSAYASEKNAYFAVESFNWREFVDGNQVVKESGPLYAVGFNYFIINNDTTFKPAIELFIGSVDYHGYACDTAGNCEAATTTVDYRGLKIEGDIGHRFRPGREFFIEPFGGLGFRFWTRDIGQGTTASGQPTTGYPENWITLRGRLGVRTGMAFQDKRELFAEGGVKIPFFSENTAYLSNAGQGPDITLSPGKQVSYFAEAGIRIRSFKGSFFYDALRFSRSDIVSNGSVAAFQPESRMDVYGVKLGIVF